MHGHKCFAPCIEGFSAIDCAVRYAKKTPQGLERIARCMGSYGFLDSPLDLTDRAIFNGFFVDLYRQGDIACHLEDGLTDPRLQSYGPTVRTLMNLSWFGRTFDLDDQLFSIRSQCRCFLETGRAWLRVGFLSHTNIEIPS